MTVPWSATNATIVEATEMVATRGPSHLVGRLGVSADGTTLFPIAAIVKSELVQLAYDDVPGRRRRRRLRAAPFTTERAEDSVDRLARRLARLVERGTAALDDEQLATEARWAAAAGFVSVERVLADAATDPAGRIYRAVHLVAEHRHLVRLG
ncbi:MAG: hypothetical protein AAGE98_05925 [Actinomycetota bacterium]